MSIKRLSLLSLFIFAFGLMTGMAMARLSAGTQSLQTKQLLDNPRVTVTEITMPAGARREAYTRPTDQIIVFLDEADYEAIDDGGKKQVRHRESGGIVWHSKGEAAPLLVNTGKKTYRNLVINLK
jgi:hypothetical protein